MASRAWLPAFGVAAAALVLAACQPVDEVADAPAATPAAVASDLLGNPDEDFPATLAELRAYGRERALTWQDDPLLSTVTVYLDGAAWQRVRLTYVAADADRILTVTGDPEGARAERQTLAGLELVPVSAEGVSQLPELPAATLEPAALVEAAAPALEQCGAAGEVAAVLYANGAPEAWDGEAWTAAPVWRATVLTPQGGVVVRPEDAVAFAPLTCPDPLLPDLAPTAAVTAQTAPSSVGSSLPPGPSTSPPQAAASAAASTPPGPARSGRASPRRARPGPPRGR